MLNKLASRYSIYLQIFISSYPFKQLMLPKDSTYTYYTLMLLQVSGVLELDQTPEGTARYSALDKWVNQLSQLQKVVVNKMA